MTHSRLVLTEKAIKNHSKRLQKELNSTYYSRPFSLGQSQQILAKSLGFNNFHELQQVLSQSHHISFNFYEKTIVVFMCLVLDGQHILAFNMIREITSELHNDQQQFIENLFKHYEDTIFSIHQKKEFIILRLLDKAKNIIPLPSAYFLFIRTTKEKFLWDLLFFSGRNINVIKNEKTREVFQQYHYIFN